MNLNLSRLTVKQLINSNIYLGASSLFLNTKIKPYLLGIKGTNYVFNISFTFLQLKQLINVILNIISYRQKILIVKNISFYQFADQLLISNLYYYEKKWVGGALTNYRMVRRSKKFLKENKELNSIMSLRYMPSLLFLLNADQSKWALFEGYNLEIPIGAIVSNDSCYFDYINYPVVGNNKSFESIYLYISLLKNAVIAGKRKERLKILRIL